MFYRKLLFLLLAGALCLCVCSCTGNTDNTATDTTTTIADTAATTTTTTATTTTTVAAPVLSDGCTPLLYKACDNNGNTVWLFGSIHVANEDMYPLPSYVTEAYNDSDALAVECDVLAAQEDVNTMTQLAMLMMYTDGTTIANYISEELYQDAVAILTELNTYSEFMDFYKPSMWSSTIDAALVEKCGYNGEHGIDAYFLNNAKTTNKEIREIESAAAQYTMLAGFSAPLQEILLQSSVDAYRDPQAKDELEGLVNAWRSGNEQQIQSILDEEDEIADDERALYEEYNKAMSTDRNILMADYAEQALKNGEEIFICVGAAHIVADGGMVDLLTKRGYTVENVTDYDAVA